MGAYKDLFPLSKHKRTKPYPQLKTVYIERGNPHANDFNHEPWTIVYKYFVITETDKWLVTESARRVGRNNRRTMLKTNVNWDKQKELKLRYIEERKVTNKT